MSALVAKKYLTVSAFMLFSLILLGVVFVVTYDTAVSANSEVTYPSWLVLSYIAGLSMIALPCTLPLVFIVVPLSVGKGARQGLVIALLFGVGLTCTITFYGLGIGVLGGATGLDDISTYMFLVAGIAAFVFGLSQTHLINLHLPSYSGSPKFIQKRGNYAKALFMGLLLGNAGVGCPNPLFYWLLIYVASTGSAEIGSSLGLVHGLGRAIPLILLSVLAIIGINATKTITTNRLKIESVSGWMLIVIGSFLIINGLPGGHQWYEDTIIHIMWNNLVSVMGIPPEFQMERHTHDSPVIIPPSLIPGILAIMILSPVGWYYMKKARS